MKISHLLTIGAAVALAAGASAGVLILDKFSDAAGSPQLTAPGPIPPGPVMHAVDYSTVLTSDPAVLNNYTRQIDLWLTKTTGPGVARVTATVDDINGTFNYFASDPASGEVRLSYGGVNNPQNPELNLNRSAFGVDGGIGLYLAGWRSDFPVGLTVTIFANETGVSTPAALQKGWTYTVPGGLPGGQGSTPADPWIVNGGDFTALNGTGVASLSDIDSIVFDFTADHQATDFHFSAIGIPEPGAYAGMAGLGLLGFAGWRRVQKRA